MKPTSLLRFHPNNMNMSGMAHLRNVVLNTKLQVPVNRDQRNDNDTKPVLKETRKKQPKSKTNVNAKSSYQPKWTHFNQSFNESYSLPDIAQINKTNQFYNKAKVKFEWGVSDFKLIPSEIVKEKFKDRDVQQRSSSNNKRFPGKTSIPFQLINALPEITFLGRSNAGKSTILNNLITQLDRKELNQEARMSNKPGFTKTLNCFNIGNKFRLIDTPGYGFGSRNIQGDMTMQFIEHREELVRCYVLISASQGFTNLDLQIINYLKDIGRPFEIIFTKMDKMRNIEKLLEEIEQSGIRSFPTLPRLIFTNSATSKYCPKRYGITELRHIILENCGLSNV